MHTRGLGARATSHMLPLPVHGKLAQTPKENRMLHAAHPCKTSLGGLLPAHTLANKIKEVLNALVPYANTSLWLAPRPTLSMTPLYTRSKTRGTPANSVGLSAATSSMRLRMSP